MTAKPLARRAIIRVAPRNGDENVADFLQGLLTNDVTGDLPAYAALLSAQGKAMFDFLVWPGEDGSLLLDCEAESADDLVKRLSLYRLRRPIDIAVDESLAAYWSERAFDGALPDPRLPALGYRAVAPADIRDATDEAYRAHRLALGVPEGQAELGDILWLETNAVELNGVSFDKGCYIGQENTARMNWRQKVNRRLVVVPLASSEEKRRKAAYPDVGLAVDHLRVADLDPQTLPDWQAAAIGE
ncbi:CAF17-like 4Fe-4S cluster assembly/insertion protein YgfZ [Erythrobacter rubeus]|uniref:Folate-binding protein n=1 Tax=Erythrobacter rubeus TaxID=2760803 RepID=A0ABR8KT65_9SPHN|nr:folate-binding protein [Erythrobacter rubeus]MBD2842283.1 folate-binding protein [Erythrobacter rubeus]